VNIPVISEIANSVQRGAKVASQYAADMVLPLVPRFYEHLRWYLVNRFYNLTNEGYRFNSAVYACINLLSQSAPEAPLRVYRDKGGKRTEMPDHPLRKLMKRPNRQMSEFEFWEMTLIHLSIVGTSWWWKQRNKAGDVIALWPLRPDRVYPRYGSGAQPLEAWSYYVSGYFIMDLNPQDVLYFHYPDPLGETAGLNEGWGPLQVAAREVDTDNVATGFIFSMLDNYAAPAVFLSTEQEISDADGLEKVKQSWSQMYGRGNRGKVAVGMFGLKMQLLSFNPRQLELNTTRNSLESRICSAFKVPPQLAGVEAGQAHSTFNNVEQARAFFTETTLTSIWRRLQDTINRDLLPDFEGLDSALEAQFDTSQVRALAEMFKGESDQFTGLFQAGIMYRDEVREKMRLDPIDNGVKVFILPANTQAVDEQGEPIVEPEPKPQPMFPPGLAQHLLGNGGNQDQNEGDEGNQDQVPPKGKPKKIYLNSVHTIDGMTKARKEREHWRRDYNSASMQKVRGYLPPAPETDNQPNA
jgi:HK97 family phage portal protein